MAAPECHPTHFAFAFAFVIDVVYIKAGIEISRSLRASRRWQALISHTVPECMRVELESSEHLHVSYLVLPHVEVLAAFG